MNQRHTRTLIALCAAGLLAGCTESGDTSLAFSGQTESPDPVVVEIPLVYIERPLDAGLDDEDAVTAPTARRMLGFQPGATLMFRTRASASVPSRQIAPVLTPAGAEEAADDGSEEPTGTAPGLFDIRDLETNYDGSSVVFSMRGPLIPGADAEDQPSWNLWSYDVAGDTLTRVIESDTVAAAGHDRDPHFLPDGRIVFTSTRQRRAKAILLDEGRPQFSAVDEDRREPAFNLHVIDPASGDIEQLTFNQSHDQDPTVLDSGDIVFSRWDNVPGRDAFSLYRMRADGTGVELLYGYHSQNEGADNARTSYFEPRELPDGRMIVAMRSPDDGQLASNYMSIDYAGFIDAGTPTWAGGGTGSAGQEGLLQTPVVLDAPNARGQFGSVTPLWDGTDRLLVTWSQCRLIETDETDDETGEGSEGASRIVPCTDERLSGTAEEAESAAPTMADALFGLWILDTTDDTQQVVVTPREGVAITEAAVLTPRSAPVFPGNPTLSEMQQALADEAAGALHIRSVYDEDGTDTATPNLQTLANPALTPAAARPAHWLRIVKPVSLPDSDLVNLRGTAFGRSSAELMREIIGYAPIHPDGSVFTKVPANVPFAISILDADGRRTSARHRNWMQVRPGEVLTCHGCHADDSTAPHGRADAQAPSINPGGPFAGLSDAFEFMGGETMAESLALRDGPPAPAFDLEFRDIWTDPAQRTPDADQSAQYSSLSTPAPVSSACATVWNASCRINITYAEHIHPIWLVDRTVTDEAGDVVADFSCGACHSPTDAAGMPRVPAAQLDLSDGPSPNQAAHLSSYRELLFGDNEQEVVDGALIDRLVPVLDGNGDPVFETDIDGELLLDLEGLPIPVMRTVGVAPSMRTAGALASGAFLTRFGAGGTHGGYLNDAELKLISEWLDLGGQYYNDPFEVPQ